MCTKLRIVFHKKKSPPEGEDLERGRNDLRRRSPSSSFGLSRLFASSAPKTYLCATEVYEHMGRNERRSHDSVNVTKRFFNSKEE